MERLLRRREWLLLVSMSSTKSQREAYNKYSHPCYSTAALADAQHQIRTLQAELALQKEVAEAEKAKLTREHQETEGAAAGQHQPQFAKETINAHRHVHPTEALEQVEAQLAKERSDWKRIRRQLERKYLGIIYLTQSKH